MQTEPTVLASTATASTAGCARGHVMVHVQHATSFLPDAEDLASAGDSYPSPPSSGPLPPLPVSTAPPSTGGALWGSSADNPAITLVECMAKIEENRQSITQAEQALKVHHPVHACSCACVWQLPACVHACVCICACISTCLQKSGKPMLPIILPPQSSAQSCICIDVCSCLHLQEHESPPLQVALERQANYSDKLLPTASVEALSS